MPADAETSVEFPFAPPLDAFAQPVALIDAAGRVRTVNDAFAELAGASATLLRDLRRPLVHVMAGGPSPVDLIDAAADMTLPAKGVGALTRADGAVVDVAWTLGVWPVGEDTLHVLTCTDITEDKCLSCTIKASRDKYRRAFDDQTELVCRFEPDSRILFVNEAYAAAFGLEPRDMIGKRLTDYLSPRAAKRFLDYLGTFTPEEVLRDGEETFELPDGDRIHQWWRRRAIFRADGTIAAFQSVGRDLTEARRRDQERARLERIVTASPVIGMRLRWMPGLPVEYVTANLARLDYDAADLTGGAIGVADLIHPDDRRRLYRDLRRQIRAGAESFRELFRLRRRDGAPVWAEAVIQPERPDGFTTTHLELVITDVTDFMLSREEVRESQRRLQDFASAANDWFWETDSHHRFIWFSERIRERYGIDLGFALGRRRWDISDTDDNPDAWRAHRQALDARQPFRDFRVTLQLPDGERRRVSVSGRPVFDDEGRFTGYRGSSCDVTEEERTAAALEVSTRRYETIFTMSEVALIDEDFTGLVRRMDELRAAGVTDLRAWLGDDPARIGDLVGRIRVRHVNPAALALHGAESVDDLLALMQASARLPEGIHFYTEGMTQLWDGAEVVRFEGPRLRRDGSRFEVFNALRNPRSLDEAEHVVVSMVDISDRVAAERALRQAMEEARYADRAKSEFLANMSHELRTPLNAIIGFSDVIANEIFGPIGTSRYLDYAHGILESGRHLLDIIADILDLSKIEAGGLHLMAERLALRSAVDGAISLVAGRSEAGRVVLRNEVEDMAVLWADPLRFKQILLNLLSNAAKFTPPGGQVTVRAWETPDTGVHTVEVADTGVGMSTEEIDVALALFGQVQSPFARRDHGTGLGLPICRGLMEAHGGDLTILSAPGEGTRVRLTFPAPPGDDPPAA